MHLDEFFKIFILKRALRGNFYIEKNLGGGYSLNLVLKVPKYHEDHKKIKFGAIGVGKDGGITIDAKKYRFRHS